MRPACTEGAVDPAGQGELAAELDDDLGRVEVVAEPGDPVAVGGELDERDRADELAVAVGVSRHQQGLAAMEAQLEPRGGDSPPFSEPFFAEIMPVPGWPALLVERPAFGWPSVSGRRACGS